MARKKSKKNEEDELGPEIMPEMMDSEGNLEDLDFSLDVDINAPLPNTRDLTRDVMKTLNETIGDAQELEAGNKLWQQASEPLKRIQAKTAAADTQKQEEEVKDQDEESSQMILPDDSDTVKARKLREALGLGVQASEQLPPHEERKLGRDAVTSISLLANYAKRYPIENTLVTETIESLLESIRPILSVYGNAMITVLNESIYVDDRNIQLDNYGEKGFVQEMLRRRIRRIVFRSEVVKEDVRELARLFTGRPDEMVASGGAAFVLGEAGVDQIRIVESQYVTGSANETDDTALDQKLNEAGLETDEVVSAISGDPKSPRLISDELKLLYEALKAPGLLAILLMRVARETVNQADTTNLIKLNLYQNHQIEQDDPLPEGAAVSYEIIQMTCRLRYLLAMNSPVDLDQATLVIRQGMDALPQEIRKKLLQFTFWLREHRQQEIDSRLFEFRPDEYADLIYENWKDKGHWPHHFTFFSQTHAEQIARSLEARLLIAVEIDSDPAKVKLLASSVSKRLQAPLDKSLRSDQALGNSKEFNLWQQDSLKLALASRLENFNSDLTEGYTHILILLMMATTKTSHAGKFAERLAIIIEARMSSGKFEDVMYLLAAARHERINLEKQEILRDKLENVLINNTQIVPYLFLRMIRGDHAALEAMNLCTEISGEGFLAKVVTLGLSEQRVTGNTLPPDASRLLTTYLDRHAMQLLPILASTLHEGDSSTRIGLLALLGYFQDDNVRDMAMVALKDKNRDVQVAAILGLRQTQSKDIRKRIVLVASGEKEIGGLPGRCAALYVLGQLRVSELIPIATEILEDAIDERKRKKTSRELVSFAAFALYQTMSPQAFSLLKKMMKLLESMPEEQEGLSKVMGKLFKRR